ncbi:MAG: beta-propeller fold lactonase family protein [Candidatus Sulfotelmatobacter sp.]|jgi:6-phosphogluconolactonase (cycloisomerase 2 family)
MLKKAAALFFVCGSIAILVSCSTPNSRYLYAAIPGGAAGEIVAYREDPNSGALTQLAGSPITAGGAVESLVIHPSNKYLYAANSGEGDISLFTISSTGALQEITPRTLAGTAPTLLAMDSAGAYLYVANSGSYNISTYSISSSSGALTAVGTYPIGMSAMNMKLSPSGGVLYVTGIGLPGAIQAFSVSNGVLSSTPIAGSPYVTGNNPLGLAITPNGGFLYTANKIDNSISEFTVNSDGSLTALANSPVGESYAGPVSLLIDNSGKYLFVANQGSTNLAGYSIGSDGSLTLLTTSPFATKPQPSFIATDPNGKYLFVGNQSSPAVESFSLDGSTGTLTAVSTYPVPATPTSIALTP